MRHLLFLQALAKANDAGDPLWRDAAPGYLVLRFFDRWLEDGPAVMAGDPALSALKGRIRSAGVLAPEIRRTLLQFVDGLVAASDLNPTPAIGHLFEYGDYLRLSGHVDLAGHVYSTIAEALERVDAKTDPQLALAYMQFGFTSRLLGNFAEARVAYSHGESIAMQQNNLELALRAQVGLGNILRAQGNLPAAEEILTTVIEKAETAQILSAERYGRHSRGAVLHSRGHYDNAMQDFYRAYELSSGADCEFILGDLAACEVKAGYRAAARDTYRLLAYTAQAPAARSASLVNLIELAILDDDEASFYQAQLDLTAHTQRHQIPVEHMAHAALNIAIGVERFGSVEGALEAYRVAAAKARDAKIYQVEFEAEKRLTELMVQQGRKTTAPQPVAVFPPPALRYITDKIAAAASSAVATSNL